MKKRSDKVGWGLDRRIEKGKVMSELVIELSVEKGSDGIWYRKGLDMKGDECWEECEDDEEKYSDNWVEDVLKEVRE